MILTSLAEYNIVYTIFLFITRFTRYTLYTIVLSVTVLYLSFNRPGDRVGVWRLNHRVLHRARGEGHITPHPTNTVETGYTAVHGRQKYKETHGYYSTAGNTLSDLTFVR